MKCGLLALAADFQVGLRTGLHINQTYAREVASDDTARQLVVGQPMKMVIALGKGGIQVFATRLLFNQQRTGPKRINAAVFITQLFHVVLKVDDAALGQAEFLKNLMEKDLRFSVFADGIGEVFGEGSRADTDFV